MSSECSSCLWQASVRHLKMSEFILPFNSHATRAADKLCLLLWGTKTTSQEVQEHCWAVGTDGLKIIQGADGHSRPSWPRHTCRHVCRLAFWLVSKFTFEGTFTLKRTHLCFFLQWWIHQGECFADLHCGHLIFPMETVCPPRLAWHVTQANATCFMVSAFKGWKKIVNQALGQGVFSLCMCWMPCSGMRQGNSTVWNICALKYFMQ